MPAFVPTTWRPHKMVSPNYWGTGNLVETRFADSMMYANQAFETTQEFITTISDLLDDFVTPESDIDDVNIPDLEPLSYDNVPALAREDFEPIPIMENNVTEPKFTEMPDWLDVDFPPFNITPPDYEQPEAPEHDVIPDPGEPDAIAAIEYPTKPDITLPDPPTLEDIPFPSAPSITLPEFEGEVPSLSLGDLPTSFSYEEAEYDSDIWPDLLAKVLYDIRNGGTGLDATVEQELYDRALRRTETENERLYDEIENYFEARNWDMPPGAMAGRLAEANREISRNNITINAEITINQAELAQKNTHFMIEAGIKLEEILRAFFDQQANRALEAAKATAQISIEIYNARVVEYNAMVAAYQAESVVYESRVKAALAQVEIFKTEVEACKVMSDIQENLVNIYKIRVEALDAYMRLYATEMEAAKIKAETERLKLEIFRLEVQTYIARLEADKMKFEVYVSQLEAEKTKAQVYSEQVRAYVSQVEAVKAQLETQVQRAELVLKENDLEIARYKAALAGYETEVRAVVAENSILTDTYKIEATQYAAQVQAESSWLNAKIAEMNVGIEKAKTELEKAVEKIKAEIQGFTAVKGLQVEGYTGIMNVAAQLCASALGAVNATANVGYSGSESSAEAWNHGEDISEEFPHEKIAA